MKKILFFSLVISFVLIFFPLTKGMCTDTPCSNFGGTCVVNTECENDIDEVEAAGGTAECVTNHGADYVCCAVIETACIPDELEGYEDVECYEGPPCPEGWDDTPVYEGEQWCEAEYGMGWTCCGIITEEEDTSDSTTSTISAGNPMGGTMDPRQVVSNVVKVILVFLGVITLIVFIISGLMMMFSGGNEETFKKARTAMVWAVIGLAITLSSYAILSFLFSNLT